MRRFYFQVLDIIHFWADTRGLSVSIAGNEISVSSVSDISPEAVKVCSFISFIIGHTWAYRTIRTNSGYTVIFYEVSKSPVSGSPHQPAPGTAGRKAKKGNEPPKMKSLFD